MNGSVARHRSASLAAAAVAAWVAASASAAGPELSQEMGMPAAAELVRNARLSLGGFRAMDAGAAQPDQPVPQGTPAAPFLLGTVDGGFLSFKASRDDLAALAQAQPGAPILDLTGKTVLLVFWDVYLPNVRATLEDMQALAAAYGPRGLAVAGVAVRSDAATLLEFLSPVDPRTGRRQARYGFPVALGDGVVPGQYQVQNIPMFFLIGPSGRVLWDMQGRRTADGDPNQDVTRRTIDQAVSKFLR